MDITAALRDAATGDPSVPGMAWLAPRSVRADLARPELLAERGD